MKIWHECRVTHDLWVIWDVELDGNTHFYIWPKVRSSSGQKRPNFETQTFLFKTSGDKSKLLYLTWPWPGIWSSQKYEDCIEITSFGAFNRHLVVLTEPTSSEAKGEGMIYNPRAARVKGNARFLLRKGTDMYCRLWSRRIAGGERSITHDSGFLSYDWIATWSYHQH